MTGVDCGYQTPGLVLEYTVYIIQPKHPLSYASTNLVCNTAMSSSAPSTPSVHFSRDTLDNNSTTNNSDADVVLKRRLAKALQVASNLKSKTLIEQEVNKELAKRNADVRAKNRALEKQVEDMKDMLMSIESAFAQLQQTTLEHVPESKAIKLNGKSIAAHLFLIMLQINLALFKKNFCNFQKSSIVQCISLLRILQKIH